MRFENCEELKIFLNERFGIMMPDTNMTLTKTKGHGIRVHAKGIRTDRIFGLEGFMAYSHKDGLNFHFIQLIGHLAKRNVIALNLDDMKKYTSAESIKKKIKIERGPVILAYKGHILGYGVHDGNGSITCPIKEKKRRNVENNINSWPGRNL
jgi:NOL1/NOP2/fmu family ribosome biogenesis protein